MPIHVPPIPFIGRRKRRGATQAAPPPLALTLVAAGYDDVTGTLTLAFDRAIDIAGIVPGDVVVDDGTAGIEWGGTADATLAGPETAAVVMIENGEFTGTGVTLTVTGG